MADNTRTPLITSDPFSYFAKGVKSDIGQRTFIKGGDVLARTTDRGTQFSIHPKFKYAPNYMQYVGDWHVSASYNLNDVVSVFPLRVGDDPTKSPQELLEDQLTGVFGGVAPTVQIGEAANGQTMEIYVGNYVPPNIEGWLHNNYRVLIPKRIPSPGTYVCVAPVPSLTYLYDLFDSNTVAITPSAISEYLRVGNLEIGPNGEPAFVGVNYLPVYPEDKQIPSAPNTDNLNTFTGSYWRYLGAFEDDSGEGCQCRYH